MNGTVHYWDSGWILDDCKKIAAIQNLSAADIQTFDVYYEDCKSPWILCRHKDSPDPIDHFFEIFSRIPVRARSHVKGAISLPGSKNNYAFNHNNYLVIVNVPNALSNISVYLHETGHSLDVNAYADSKPRLSNSSRWDAEYQQDSKVPDTYSAFDAREDVAQNTVVAAYDLNVPGGFASVEPDWASIQHQFKLIEKEQKDAGDLLIPGGTCTKRMENSQPVKISGKSSRRRGAAVPDVTLAEGLEIIPPSYFSTEGSCGSH